MKRNLVTPLVRGLFSPLEKPWDEGPLEAAALALFARMDNEPTKARQRLISNVYRDIGPTIPAGTDG